MPPPKKKFGKKKKGKFPPPGEQVIIRVRTPRGREVIGVVESRLGGSRMRVQCFDGKSRAFALLIDFLKTCFSLVV